MKYNLDYCEFYITNVCNLNCINCNRFNNYIFKGNYSWKEHEKEYQKWSKILNLKKICILGGEPTLHPNLKEYIEGIRELWPNSNIRLTTNGTTLTKKKELYSLLQKNNVWLNISVHNKKTRKQLINNVKSFLSNIKSVSIELENGELLDYDTAFDLFSKRAEKKYNEIKGNSWPEYSKTDNLNLLSHEIKLEFENDFNLSINDYNPHEHIKNYRLEFIDDNNIRVLINPKNYFHESSIIEKEKSLTLYNSSPDKAIEICGMKYCHHFIEGKLYKCGVVGILPEFLKQFDVQTSDENKNLINSYKPASADMSDDFLDNFMQNLISGESIPQCKFCPEKHHYVELSATIGKNKFPRKEK